MTIGAKFRSKGFTPCKPVLVIPGLCSSCLAVVESPYEDWIGQQIWLNLGSIGFDKILLGNLLRNKKSTPSETNASDLDAAQKRKWMQHMCLKKDGLSDPDGIKVRAVKGLKGCAYLETHSIMNSLSYVMGPLFDALQDAGYTDRNLKALPYDWRLSPLKLEERDCYFTEMKQVIQQMYSDNGQKVVVIAHSLGTRVFHYFLLWIQDTVGRQWIDEKIEMWIPVGPLWLGAPKSIRAVVAGERMGLEDFLYPEEGIELTNFASSAWMFPFWTPDFEFQEYSFWKNPETNKFETKSLKEIFHIGKVPHQWDMFEKYYLQDKYFRSQEQMLAPPPINNILCIYGVNLKTETFYFFRNNQTTTLTELELDPEATFTNYVVEGGIAYETKDTKQNMLRGKPKSGDGTVPYASLSYCKKWRKDIKVRVEELDQADHRVILKDKRLHTLILEAVCKAPSLEILPATFTTAVYEVARVMQGQVVKMNLKLTRRGLKAIYPRSRKKTMKYPYNIISNISVDDEDKTRFCIEITRQALTKRLTYKSPHRQDILNELVHRCRFLEEGTVQVWQDDERDAEGQTPLHKAALANNVTHIFTLLHEGYDINAIDNNCFTPLHTAAKSGHLDACLVLLQQADIDVEKQTNDGYSALHYLCMLPDKGKEYMDNVVRLLELMKSKGGDVNQQTNEKQSCLHIAITSNITTATWVIEKGGNVNLADSRGDTPLHLAIRAQNQAAVMLLLNNGGDKHRTNKAGKSCLALAQETPELFQVLCKSYSHRERQGTRRRNTITTPPLPSMKDVDEYLQTPLHRAAYEGNLNLVYEYVCAGVDTNAKDRNGWSPLHCAASKGNHECVLVILGNNETNVDDKTNDNTSVLHYIVRHTYSTDRDTERCRLVLEKMLAKGVDVNIADNHGETPLHQAAMRGNEFCVKWLLENGANVHALTNRNDSVLHYAILSGKTSVVKEILSHGADTTVVSQRNGTVAEMVQKMKMVDMEEVLKTTYSPKPQGRRTILGSARTSTPPPLITRSQDSEEDMISSATVVFTLGTPSNKESTPPPVAKRALMGGRSGDWRKSVIGSQRGSTVSGDFKIATSGPVTVSVRNKVVENIECQSSASQDIQAILEHVKIAVNKALT